MWAYESGLDKGGLRFGIGDGWLATTQLGWVLKEVGKCQIFSVLSCNSSSAIYFKGIAIVVMKHYYHTKASHIKYFVHGHFVC